jgi:GxxExxY protein
MATNEGERTALPHGDLTNRILACFFEAFGELGHGFSEAVLRRGLAIVLEQAGLEVWQEAEMQVHFRGKRIGLFYADLIVERTVLVEIKGTVDVEPCAIAQTLNYLKAAGGGIALILNFGRQPKFKRLVMGDPLKSLPLMNPSTARSGRAPRFRDAR